MIDYVQNQQGVIAVISMLIVLSLGLLISLSLSSRGIDELDMALLYYYQTDSFYSANLCLEYALMALKDNLNYLGNETIALGGKECCILPIEGSWIVRVSATSSQGVKKIEAILSQINPVIIIDSIEEVVSF